MLEGITVSMKISRTAPTSRIMILLWYQLQYLRVPVPASSKEPAPLECSLIFPSSECRELGLWAVALGHVPHYHSQISHRSSFCDFTRTTWGKVYSKFLSLRQWLRRKRWVVQSPPLGSRLRGVDCGPWRNADVKNNSPVLGILIVDFFLGGLRSMNASNPALLLTVPKFMRSVVLFWRCACQPRQRLDGVSLAGLSTFSHYLMVASGSR